MARGTTNQMLIGGLLLALVAADAPSTREAEVIYQNDFRAGVSDFAIELEKGGTVDAKDGVLTIDVPGGCTVWLKRKLEGAIVIEYEATLVAKAGPNDRVSDLNCFWMAGDPTSPDDLFKHPRTGKFSDYDTLRTYYVGHGGNNNTTTRFRRYIGEHRNRPLLPEHDLKDAKFLLKPNTPTKVKLVADGPKIEYWRDGERLFSLDDPEPYRQGHFAFRTTTSHIEIRNLRITRP